MKFIVAMMLGFLLNHTLLFLNRALSLSRKMRTQEPPALRWLRFTWKLEDSLPSLVFLCLNNVEGQHIVSRMYPNQFGY